MRICVDLDGVICELKQSCQSYEDVVPIEGAIEKLCQLRDNGHYIIIHTARHMKTCDGNVAKVLARKGKSTLDWLGKYGVPYDEILFGKPWADIYIDDNALRFISWDEITSDASNLPCSREKVLGDK